MRVLLINPPTPLEERPNPPLGLAFVAAALEEAAIEVRIVDMVTHPLDRSRLETLLDEYQPQIVGATAVTMTFHGAVRALRDVKAIDPDIVTVMGGPHVTFTPKETLVQIPEIDLIVMGTVGRTGISGFLIGNTAEKILNTVDCSVLTLKPEGFKSPVKK